MTALSSASSSGASGLADALSRRPRAAWSARWLKRGGQSWADRAEQALLARGIPHRGLEDWRYTSVGGAFDASLAAPSRPMPAESMKIAAVPREAAEASGDLVFYNGHFVPSLSRLPESVGVRVTAMAAIEPTLAESALAPFAGAFPDDRFASGPWFDAWNAALAQDAILISLEAGTVLTSPLAITCISSSLPGEPEWTVSAPRIFARFARGSEGAVIERHVTLGAAPCLSTPAVDVVLDEGARVAWARVQAEGSESRHFGSLRASVGRSASFESLQISIGGKIARQELTVSLEGAGAETRVDGLYLTSGSQHADNRTSIVHSVGDTSSSQLYKGILADESRAVFNGRIRIEPQAQRSNASQLCQNLALSKRAEVDAKPELEIFADDVKASHGATVGRLDPEQLFYFQSRAIAPDQAMRTLAIGFARDVLYRGGAGRLRPFVERDVESKLASALAGGLASRAGSLVQGAQR